MGKVIVTNINGESIALGNQASYYLQVIDEVSNIPVTTEVTLAEEPIAPSLK